MSVLARSFQPGISDSDLAAEHKAQRILYAAVTEFRSKVQDAQALTNIFKDDLSWLLDAVEDNTPSQTQWDEKIAMERLP